MPSSAGSGRRRRWKIRVRLGVGPSWKARRKSPSSVKLAGMMVSPSCSFISRAMPLGAGQVELLHFIHSHAGSCLDCHPISAPGLPIHFASHRCKSPSHRGRAGLLPGMLSWINSLASAGSTASDDGVADAEGVLPS